MWTVYFGRLFDEWFEEQELALKRKVLAELKHLEEFGPSLSHCTCRYSERVTS